MNAKITKLTGKSVRVERIRDDGETTSRVYDADFYATGDERTNVVSLHRLEKPFTTVSLAPSDLEINGEVPASVEEAVTALNEFVGNFRGGGISAEDVGKALEDVLENAPPGELVTEEI